MSFLEICDLGKRYPVDGSEVVALEGLSLRVEQGEFVVLLGPSGCGKSTLLQVVAGLEPPSAGMVRLEGRAVNGWGQGRILIFQRPNLFPWLTALENVAFGLRLAGYTPSQRRRLAREALARLGLEGALHLYPHELSGGMQQRVALARALVLDPAILLMDEPLAALDALLRTRLQRELRLYCRGRTVLFVTHSIREALILADRLVLLTPRPGRVRRELVPPGRPPRPYSPALALLEQEMENEMLAAEG